MVNKKNIIKIIDIKELNKAIDEYLDSTGDRIEPYLFMNQSTFDGVSVAVETTYGDDLCDIAAKLDGIAGYYCGYKVFKDNTLKFGEIEIR